MIKRNAGKTVYLLVINKSAPEMDPQSLLVLLWSLQQRRETTHHSEQTTAYPLKHVKKSLKPEETKNRTVDFNYLSVEKSHRSSRHHRVLQKMKIVRTRVLAKKTNQSFLHFVPQVRSLFQFSPDNCEQVTRIRRCAVPSATIPDSISDYWSQLSSRYIVSGFLTGDMFA